MNFIPFKAFPGANSLLQQRLRQFLVHSYLYYKLDESIISDTEYDRICMELRELLKNI